MGTRINFHETLNYVIQTPPTPILELRSNDLLFEWRVSINPAPHNTSTSH